MSVVIKMDMPKSCFHCHLCDPFGKQILCKAGNLVFDQKQLFTGTRHHNCPIICELPQNHGDLIDRSELLKNYNLENCTKYGNQTQEQQRHSYDTLMMYEIADMIEDAPTVIEAEGKYGE